MTLYKFKGSKKEVEAKRIEYVTKGFRVFVEPYCSKVFCLVADDSLVKMVKGVD